MVNFINLNIKQYQCRSNNKCLICLLWLLFSLTLATCYMNYDKNKIEMTLWEIKRIVIYMSPYTNSYGHSFEWK